MRSAIARGLEVDGVHAKRLRRNGDVALVAQPALRRHALRPEIAGIDERDDARQSGHLARTVSARSHGLGRIAAAPELATHVVADLDRCDALERLRRHAAFADEFAGLAQ